ncbi:MAG: GIY-YIG nuclease family protein [Patescibacteria group bacterium]
MYTVYVLQDKNGELYKGLTNNLPRRLNEHKNGKTKTTSRMHNIKLSYKEEYKDFEEARRRELYFKSAAGRRFLKKILRA